MGFVSQPPGRFTLFLNGRAALDFDASLLDAVWSRSDGAVTLRYRVREANEEDSNGLLEIAASPDWAPPGDSVSFEVRGSASESQRWFGLYDTRPLLGMR
ncbi:MAG: hypothetical protein JNL10_09015 [Verrucomicrobiales bacterium]|nr:hypothetical protein [Verrucomicrobiales bacterium]